MIAAAFGKNLTEQTIRTLCGTDSVEGGSLWELIQAGRSLGFSAYLARDLDLNEIFPEEEYVIAFVDASLLSKEENQSDFRPAHAVIIREVTNIEVGYLDPRSDHPGSLGICSGRLGREDHLDRRSSSMPNYPPATIFTISSLSPD